MFERLVESNASDADLKPRRKFFFVSSVVVGILFATAVIASIYAADFDLGNDNFDLAELLTPITETEPVKDPELRDQPRDNQQNTASETTRQVLMASTSDPTRVPTTTSTAVNPYLSISDGKFKIGPRDVTAPPPDANPGNEIGNSSAQRTPELEDTDPKTAPPAPPKIEKPKTVISDVVNGKATYLPKPIYSPAAIAMGARGTVNVQVTIDESGKVISAKAVSGNPLLRVEAQKAAWNAKFSPTYLSKVPVKVTGVIVYNFIR